MKIALPAEYIRYMKSKYAGDALVLRVSELKGMRDNHAIKSVKRIRH